MPGGGFDGNAALVSLDDALGDSHPEAAALPLALRHEWLEKSLPDFLGNPRAVVTDREYDLRMLRLGYHHIDAPTRFT